MFGLFERNVPQLPPRRMLPDVCFATLAEAVAYFQSRGGFIEIDGDAADVCTAQGQIWQVERLA